MSFFGVSRPPDITWSLADAGPGGSGQAIVSSIGNLTDGRPDSTARFQWPTGGSQTTSTVLKLRGDWTATAFSPRAVMLSNISLPVGTKVSVAFRRTSDTLGTYPYVPTMLNNNQRIVALARGERTVIILLPAGASNCLGVEISIWNDVNGSVGNSAGLGLFNIGEAVVCPGLDVDVLAGHKLIRIDPTTRGFSWTSQPYLQPGVPWREWTFGLPVDSQEAFYGDPANLAITDYDEFFALLDRGQSALYVPRYVDGANAFSAQMLHRTAFLGFATQLPSFDHESGTWLSTRDQAHILEAPIAT